MLSPAHTGLREGIALAYEDFLRRGSDG